MSPARPGPRPRKWLPNLEPPPISVEYKSSTPWGGILPPMAPDIYKRRALGAQLWALSR
ncbi:unnamed protein product, partial [Amoebophrya sp. A120]|eukprot:GSA120T00026393001.1